MSEFGKPNASRNGCGLQIYFDRNSLGHPTSDKWLPLEYKEGRRTDQIHNCSKKKQTLNGNGYSSNPTSIPIAAEKNYAEQKKEDTALEALNLEFKTLIKHISEYLKANKQ